MNPLLTLAPAKINLSLRVLAREASGYHQIETLFCALELADELEIAAGSEGVSLSVLAPPDEAGPAPDLGPLQRNLAYRAAVAFFEESGIRPVADVRLTKRIPTGAGLGGGSSDAAAVLKGLNRLYGEPLRKQHLLETAASLGSDVPFFLTGAALALAWGRGGRLAPLPPLPARPVVLAVPGRPVATAGAYEWLAAGRDEQYVAPPAILSAPIASWTDAAAVAGNDFEGPVFARMPLLAQLRAALQAGGAGIARMTGTGSVLFGVFDDVVVAEAVAQQLSPRFPDVRFLLTRTASQSHSGVS